MSAHLPHSPPSPPPAFAALGLFNFSCVGGRVTVCRRGFKLHFPGVLAMSSSSLGFYLSASVSGTVIVTGCFPWIQTPTVAASCPARQRASQIHLPWPPPTPSLLAGHSKITLGCRAPPRTPAGTRAGPTELTLWASFSLKNSNLGLERAKSCLTRFVPFFSCWQWEI